MTSETKKKFLINISFFSVWVLVFYLSLKYAFIWGLPFLFGFFIAYISNAVARRVCAKTKLNQRGISVIVVAVIFALASLLLFVFLDKAIATVQKYTGTMPDFYFTNVAPILESGKEFLDNVLSKVAPRYRIDTTSVASFVNDNAGEFISSISKEVIDFLGLILKNVPRIFVAFIFTVLSSFFFVIDYQNIVGFIYKQLPEKVKRILANVKATFLNSVLKTFKAYLLIFLVTFAEVSVGLMILKVENAISKALLISFIDFLPLLGLAVAFIPWILLCLLKRDFYLAIGLSIVFLIVAVVRSFIEPKIVGKQIGLSPIVSLLCFYFGIKFFGILGAFILSIAAIILKQLNEDGTLKLWKP